MAHEITITPDGPLFCGSVREAEDVDDWGSELDALATVSDTLQDAQHAYHALYGDLEWTQSGREWMAIANDLQQ